MRKKILILLVLFSVSSCYLIGQTTTRATIVNTSPQRASIYVKPNNAVTGQILDMGFAISIPDQSGSGGNPTVTVDSNFVPNVTWDVFNGGNAVIYNGRAYYIFTGTDNSSGTNFSWTTGNNKLFTIGFSNTNGLSGLQINDETPSGGSNGLMFYYINQIGGNGDLTDYAQKFYGTSPAPVNNLNSPSFVGAQAISLLPIAFKDFNVAKQGTGTAMLTWSTTFEQNASHFIIERSIKQSDTWAKIAEVKARGNSAIESKYTYTDANVYDGREVAKTVFYRIRAIDLDAAEKLFPVRSVRFTALGDKEINIFPNPAQNGFYIQIPTVLRTDMKVRLSLVNRLGQVVDTREINAALATNYYFDITAPSITSGDYALDIIYDGQKLATKKVMVNR
jgi:hypothetical protein